MVKEQHQDEAINFTSFVRDENPPSILQKKITQRFDTSKYIQNAIDILRVIELPDEDGEFLFLVDRSLIKRADATDDADSDVSEDSDHEDPGEIDERPQKIQRKTQKPLKVEKKTKMSVMSTAKQLTHRACYKKHFAKAWLMLLSLPLTKAQHKLVLKHIPDHVLPELPQPLLLADYLTRSYQEGGFVAVLALGSTAILFIIN